MLSHGGHPMEQLFAQGDLVSQLHGPGVAVMLPRMLVAVAIAALIALRPWRLLWRRPLPKREIIQAQILLCAAAAVITVVIGDSVAKAFGLVGLGSFVRFKSGIKDQRDAAVLFLMIGLGMACGHGSVGLALVGGAFLALLLFAIDVARGEEHPKHRMKVCARSDDPVRTEAELRRLFREKNVVVKSSSLDLMGNTLELELEERELGGISAVLSREAAPRGSGFAWTGATVTETAEERV